MNCKNCGIQNMNGEKFCKNCGVLLENNLSQQPINNQVTNENYQNNNIGVQPNQQPINSQALNQNYQNNINYALNPNMKKWAVLSVIVPIAGIVWYWFIGLSFYLAIFIAAAGFGFAEKGKMANQKLALIGKILNGVLCGMAVIMLILQLIGAFAS